MEYWIIYDVATGAPLYRGSGERGSSAYQQLPEGAALVLVPLQVVSRPELDLDALRAAMATRVDAAAEALRMRFLTPGDGQSMTYTRKEAEARAWSADNSIAVPFLTKEATKRSMTVAQLVAEVIGRADAWAEIGSDIEAERMAAKTAVAAAETFGAIVAAADLQWPA